MVENVRQYGTPPANVTGVFLCQAFCTVLGGNLSNLYRGVFCQSTLGTGDEWPFDGADDCNIIGVTMRNCTDSAVWCVRDRVRIMLCSMNGSYRGAGLVSSGSQTASYGIVIGNDMTDVTLPMPFNDGSSMIAHSNIGVMDFKTFSLMEDGKVAHTMLSVGKTLRIGVGMDSAGTVDSVNEIARFYSVASPLSNTANRLDVIASYTGQPLRLAASGSDTDIDFGVYPKGAGRLRIGTARTATSDAAITGYIEVKDSGGTVRKLAIID